MSPESPGELFALFSRACALPSADRAAFLAQLGRENPAAARELEELLAQEALGGPLPSAPSKQRSLVESLVAALARTDDEGNTPSSLVLEKLAARTPAVSRYSILGELARGGMGAILAVWDEDIGRELAMKVALGSPHAASDAPPRLDAHTLARFLEEAQVTGQLDHPGIVPVHELGLDRDGRVFFTMRLVKGRNLGEILDLVRRGEEGWTQTRALGVLLKVCEAMSYAHSNGVVHRDLKPANVMIGRFGEVYVMDWGLARARARRGLPEGDEPPEGSEPAQGLLATGAGIVLGTPAYMPPEQAAGRLAEVDERSDVYAMGAMLYELLSGRMPYCDAEERPAPRALLARVLAGAPARLQVLAPGAPAELVAIAEKAMSRAPARRYRDMGELGDDVRAFLEGRVVRAYETGAWAEARKWIERNRALSGTIAAGILALIAGLSASLILKAQSDRNASLAAERAKIAAANENRALQEKDRADREADSARKKADEVLRLSALQRLDDLVAEADGLWPASPERIEEYVDWLGRARELVEELPIHEAKLAELRARARPSMEAETATRRESDPRARELASARMQLEFIRKQRSAIDSGAAQEDPSPAEAGVDFAKLPGDAGALNRLAWARVDPERREWGEEAKGLVLARQALERASDSERPAMRDTLAWALFASGRFDEAMEEEEAALEEARPERRAQHVVDVDRLRRAIEAELGAEGARRAEARMALLRGRIEELGRELSAPAATFDDAEDKWWHNQLEKLANGLKSFADPGTGLDSAGISPERGWGVQKRLDFAHSLRASFADGAAAETWSRALPEIRARHPGLDLGPQTGLLPIGPDPDSGLWEFAHLATGQPATRGPDGKLQLEEGTGLVFVLLPGGTFQMGAQSADPSAPNYDPDAQSNEGPVHAVTLSPFFMSKYEMTQGQWVRSTGKNPSEFDAATSFGGRPLSLLHPVELVSWATCSETLWRLGLELPTEAQWEYAARAGTSSAWWTGDEHGSLAGATNLADSSCKRNGGPSNWPYETWLDDGSTVHAPVGSYAANAFGLHDVLGNVWELCRDRHGDYRKPVFPGDGEREVSGPPAMNHVDRGGSFAGSASQARCANRSAHAPSNAANSLGLRPSRRITP